MASLNHRTHTLSSAEFTVNFTESDYPEVHSEFAD